jgi:hypothetical protein
MPCEIGKYESGPYHHDIVPYRDRETEKDIEQDEPKEGRAAEACGRKVEKGEEEGDEHRPEDRVYHE